MSIDVFGDIYGENSKYRIILFVDSDANLTGRRSSLIAGYGPSYTSLAVVGVRISHEADAPKIGVAQTEKLEEITLCGTSLDAFRALHRGPNRSYQGLQMFSVRRICLT